MKDLRIALAAAVCIAVGAALAVIPTAMADEEAPASGLAVGEKTPAFQVNAVSGPEAGETLCYVCKYAGAPQAIVFASRVDEGVVELIRTIDDYYAEHEEDGFRAFVVFTADQSEHEKDVARIAEEHEIRIPIGFLANPADAETYALNEEVPVTVLVANNREVTHNFAFAEDICAGCTGAVHDALAETIEE